MDPKHTDILFGPPGTGKTTELLAVVDDALQNGILPDQVMFIAFTRKAANEAKERAGVKFNLNPEQLPWFRTLHSLAFQQLSFNKANVMGIRDYLTLCEMLGLSITYKGINEDGTFSGLTKGDRLFFMTNMARAKVTPLRTYWEASPDEDIYWYELERLHTTLEEYKRQHGKRDFIDIINDFCELDPPIPPCKLLIVDESQDLSRLQWRMVDKLSGRIERVFLAGDDDQAIFRWAGADVDYLIQIPGHRRVLEQSYRVPSAIQEVAGRISARISVRVPKQWAPRPAVGEVRYENEFTHIDMSSGTWLLLARNAYLLDQYVTECIRQGFVFDASVGSPLRGDVFKAIRAWEELRESKEISASRAKVVYEFMSIRIGVAYGFKGKFEALPDRTLVNLKMMREHHGLLTDKPWYEALDKITAEERQYFIAALQRGERLLAEPRIKISTIHSVKGGEAENVVLQLDMAERTWREYEKNPDDEHRVWYVAVTRAKERLIFMNPRSNRSYDI